MYKISKGTKIAIDFDGTCVTHEYPKIGKDIGAVPYLKKMNEIGCILNLNTMRSGKELVDAIMWFKNNGIEISGINQDIGQKSWTNSPKVYAEIYLDDSSLGTPILYNEEVSCRPYIDWKTVAYMLGLVEEHEGTFFIGTKD